MKIITNDIFNLKLVLVAIHLIIMRWKETKDLKEKYFQL